MRKYIAVFVLLAALCASRAFADTPFLADRFGPWSAEAPVKTLKVQDLGNNWAQWTSGEVVLKESGLTRIEQRSYRNGKDAITLRVFVLQDPSTAYEFYTFLLAPGMQDLGLGENSALSQYDARFQVGHLVVQGSLSSDTKPESLKDVLAGLKAKADATPLPPLKDYLPEHWLVFGSEKYALGPEAFRSAMTSLNQGAYADLAREIGFGAKQDDAEAMMARYQGQRGSGVLLLILYPNPQLAENRLHHLEDALPAAAKRAGVTVERKASMLSIVFATNSAYYAQAIRNEVNYETQVTWNEPSQTYTDPPLVYVMFKIFVFTTFFLIGATVIGIFFGGLRILVKHWLPGKVFDRPQDIEVLQLGLSGKKIDPTDMY
jgi:Family of unknown function (DUF6599)